MSIRFEQILIEMYFILLFAHTGDLQLTYRHIITNRFIFQNTTCTATLMFIIYYPNT